MEILITITDPTHVTAFTRAAGSSLTVPYNGPISVEALAQNIIDAQIKTFVSLHIKPVITKFQFLDRFTQAERVAIRAAAATNGELNDFMAMLDVSGEVQLNNPSTMAGVQLLETVDLLDAGRAAEILAL